MAWLAVDEKGQEWSYNYTPVRSAEDECEKCWLESSPFDNPVKLEEGMIEHIIGKKLTWDDDPVEYDPKQAFIQNYITVGELREMIKDIDDHSYICVRKGGKPFEHRIRGVQDTTCIGFYEIRI